MIDPQRGEIWRVSLDPTRGAEIQKTRPALVLSASSYGRTSLRLIVPVIGWQAHFAAWVWMIEVASDAANGLTKTSGGDASQIRAVDLSRFGARLGVLDADDVETVAAAVTLCIGFNPSGTAT
jgi:mRNA interferase MazF